MDTTRRKSLNALIVDDDEFMLEFLDAALRQLGLEQIQTANSGRTALERIDSPESAIDLVLCDLNMPVMDGVEFLRHLTSRQFSGSILLVSGEDKRILKTAEDLAKAHELNVLGSIEKPIDPVTLERLLDAITPAREKQQRQEPAPYGKQDIIDAMAKKEFTLYYQPKVNVHNREVAGVETLIRWSHPEHGIIGPDSFIPLAEQYGLIDELTDFVFSAAMVDAKNWQDQGLNLKIAVNISVATLHRLDLPEMIVSVSGQQHIDSDHIILEVTESRLMESVTAPLEILTRLRLKGIGLSIDDFGTGYSSMEQLKRIPFVELKIDKAFVQGAHLDPAARAIVDSSVKLAQQLQMSVVAEGVEGQDEWDLVAALGCDLVQGYFIARPMPASEFPAWVREWNAA